MDKDQARFILQSFRPDGADAQDPDFAAALALAAEDRELGEWLAAERAQDSAFAAALSEVSIPEDLRRNILGVLEGESASMAEADFSEMDAAFVGALASVRPPDGLREQILTAMSVEEGNAGSKVTSIANAREKADKASHRVRNWLSTAAVAAAVVFGAILAVQVTSDDEGGAGTLTRSTVEYESIALISAEGMQLEKRAQAPAQLVAYLEEQGAPTPALEHLPKGLLDAPGVGCKVLQIEGKKAAVICFDKAGVGTVHLVVIDRKDVGGELPKVGGASKDCWRCPNTRLSVAAWEADDDALFLLGEMPEGKLVSVF